MRKPSKDLAQFGRGSGYNGGIAVLRHAATVEAIYNSWYSFSMIPLSHEGVRVEHTEI